jgi:hypothetical protein
MKATKIKNIILATSLLLFVILLVSCDDDATIKVINRIPNIQLKQVSFDKYSVAYSLLPGETGSYEIVDKPKYFPKRGVIKFYMVKGDNQIYLETKEVFTLNADQELLIEISEDMELVNGLSSSGRKTVKLSELE